MLNELKEVKQEEIGFRRVFLGDYFDLFVWYDRQGGRIEGFELCYNKGDDEHSIIWKENGGWLHSRVDTGENFPGRVKQSPVLTADGYFDSSSVAVKFKEGSTTIAPEIADFVHRKILSYT